MSSRLRKILRASYSVHRIKTQNIRSFFLTNTPYHKNKTSTAINVDIHKPKWSNNHCLHTEVNEKVLENDVTCIQCSDPTVKAIITKDMIVINDFITPEEEQSIVDEAEPYLKRMRYETSHWDDAIHGYRETERKQWRETNKPVIQRIRDAAFPKHVSQLSLVHILDLSKEGYIKPHVDAVRFCGNTIAGLSLLSSAVMRLVHTEDATKQADILLKQRSLYIMRDEARYKYTHEVLKSEESMFKGEQVSRDRRIAIICRNEPD